MIKIDYENKRKEQLKNDKCGKKLLLHSCCAPCSSGVIDRLIDFFEITVYFYNPNMDSKDEYDKRALEQIRFVKEAYGDKVKVVIEDYDNQSYLNVVKGYEDQPEGGARCTQCFSLRFKKSFDYALANGFDYLTTTLTVSPYKNVDLINQIGESICNDSRVKWLYADFKKANGYLNSIQNSKKFGLYRQDYCGCEFSLQKSLERKKVRV